MKHGSYSGYTGHRARGEEACPACLAAKRTYQALRRTDAAEARAATERRGGRYVANVATHGQSAYKNVGCRCAECRAAKSAEDLRTRARRRGRDVTTDLI